MCERKLEVVLSIVSHGQLRLIDSLLSDLAQLIDANFRIVLTINIPEDEDVLKKYKCLPITIVRNEVPRGFGGNHNAAFKASTSDVFVIVNPDIRVPSISWSQLFAAFDSSDVGACAPLILSSDGNIEDSARRFPTLIRLFSRAVLGRRRSDFVLVKDCQEVDWAAGMFVAYRSSAFRTIGGFDERYFMYMEDADICRRLSTGGWKTVIRSDVSVIHDAQRASRRNLRHLKWHMGSAFRFLFLASP
jgi:GT2 family glycosyltransferase